MPPVIKRAISWLGLVDDERYEEEDQPGAEKAAKVESADQPEPAPARVEFPGDNSKTQLLNPNLLVTPSSYHNIQPIADRYQTGVATLVDLRAMPVDEAKRCVDFFAGMVYALDGKAKKIVSGVFLLTPAGASVDQMVLDSVIAELR